MFIKSTYHIILQLALSLVNMMRRSTFFISNNCYYTIINGFENKTCNLQKIYYYIMKNTVWKNRSADGCTAIIFEPFRNHSYGYAYFRQATQMTHYVGTWFWEKNKVKCNWNIIFSKPCFYSLSFSFRY